MTPAGEPANKSLSKPASRLARKPLAAMLAMVFATAALGPSLPAMADPVSVKLPAQPLGESLKQFAKSTGISVVFDNELVAGKTAPAINDYMEPADAFRRLLMGSGLQAVMQGDTAVIRRVASGANNEAVRTQTIDVRAQRYHEIGPMPGLALTKEQIPGNVQSISAEEIKESHSVSIADLMNRKLQSVMVNDYQGNPFQMDVQYRGFTASPQLGTPQGLSVFFDGIRVNEPFGDVVNWDLIPSNALAGLDVFPGSNPIFGLGTLGGAVALRTKDGFNYPGVDAEVLAGSFGRKQLQVSGGINNANTEEEGSWDNGEFALFGAGSFFMEDGWRENSPSRVNQAFGKASYRGEKLDLSFSTLLVKTDLTGNGLIPTMMYEQERDSVFSSPDTTENTLAQFQLSAAYFVNDTFSVTAQAYRRKSKRHQMGGDVYTENWEDQQPLRDLAPGEEYTCLFETTNQYGLPDYYALRIPGGDPFQYGGAFTMDPSDPAYSPEILNFLFSDPATFTEHATIQDGLATLDPATHKNVDLPPELVKTALYRFHRDKNVTVWNLQEPGAAGADNGPSPTGPTTPWSGGNPSYRFAPGGSVFATMFNNPTPAQIYANAGGDFYYYDPADGELYLLIFQPPTNHNNCTAQLGGADADLEIPARVDGAWNNTGGYVPGTPVAVITDTRIDQETDGASVQFNWNLEKHKFMIGASIDAPSATYESGQRFGMLDAQRNAFLAPELIRDQYAAADTWIHNNDFEGGQVTRSIYASETWSPVETLHITGAMRYNETRGDNTIASRTHGIFRELHQLQTRPDDFDVCAPGEECETGYASFDGSKPLNPPEKEKFSYYSLNPSLGVSWQAKPSLNIFSNIAQGTRVPSVIELGCAFDDTPVVSFSDDTDGDSIPDYFEYGPKSLVENRACSLPTTLSGDPYLPQIKATSFDLGMRGRWGENAVWNLGLYRTNLKDDIYMIGYPGNKTYFDTIGKTRRQGLEAGVSGEFGKWDVSLNYSMTEATFQDEFLMPANDNSSSVENNFGNEYGRLIQVEKGDRMPGVPLHNLNASVSYKVTPKWRVGFSAVAHSFSYARGNENNEHDPDQMYSDTVRSGSGFNQLPRKRSAKDSGKVDGFMVFNFQTSYQFDPEWRLSLLVNNIFDKEYFTAARLGVNPFSPPVIGNIGISGYNHNSNEWITDNFLAPGAPRAAWLSISYEFDPRR